MVVGHTDPETTAAEIGRSVVGYRGGNQDNTLVRVKIVRGRTVCWLRKTRGGRERGYRY